MRARFDRSPAGPRGRRLLLRLGAAGSVTLATGCLQIQGLFGPTPQEQTQLQILRGLQHALSLSYNQPLAWMFKGMNETLAMGMPTFYGMDLAPYLATVPWPPAPPKDPNLGPPIYGDNQQQQSDNGEIYELQSADQRELLQFLFNPQTNQTSGSNQFPCSPASCKSLTYDVNLLRSLDNLTGQLQITTTTRTDFTKMSSPPANQPYVFGDLWKTNLPNELDATVTLNYGGQTGTISLSLTRSQTPSSDQTIQLQQVQINLNLPRISCNLSGRVSPGSLAFSNGSLSLADDQGNTHAFQVSLLSLEGTSGEATLLDQPDRLSISLSLDKGQLSGEVDSSNPDLSRSLATIASSGTQTTIVYRDRGAPEAWN